MPEPSVVSAQLASASAAFAAAFGRPPALAAVAPGRVNLIGEHTDYNDGFVLPMAIERQTVALLAPRPDKLARLASTSFPGDVVELPVDIDGRDIRHAPIPLTDKGHWSRYLRGVLAFSYTPTGFDLLIDSNVPAGGGLSSSASIEVATATILEAHGHVTLPPATKALLCQMAEHRYGGAPCGIMDQFISTMGKQGHALLVDCRSLTTTDVALDDPAVSVLIINTNAPHELSGGEYAQRRAQCAAAAKALGVRALRDAKMKDLDAAKDRMDELTYRRARHVITEVERTVTCAAALVGRAYNHVGEHMFASHDSLRDDFEVSTPELDTLVELARAEQGKAVIGARMTGGGFGGCTVTLVRTADAARVQDALCTAYEKKHKVAPTAFVTRPAQGARLLQV